MVERNRQEDAYFGLAVMNTGGVSAGTKRKGRTATNDDYDESGSGGVGRGPEDDDGNGYDRFMSNKRQRTMRFPSSAQNRHLPASHHEFGGGERGYGYTTGAQAERRDMGLSMSTLR